MTTNSHTGRDDVKRNIARGAAGVALAAGAVATGVALANRNTRRKLTTGAKKAVRGFRRIRGTLSEGGRYQAVAHRIGVGLRKKGRRREMRRSR